MAAPTRPEAHPEPVVTTRIVGIGASAGGLVALEQFLRATPADSAMAYIVVQHLDPTQKALLPELLQRITPMPVREATHGMGIAPDSVYVIPPNTELRVVGDKLNLASPTEPRGMRLPVDVLFSSLASAHGDQAVAVILSGMGSDGTLGLQAIKAVGGLTAVQEPGSAQFDAMPRSAIKSGCADLIAPAEELPGRILAIVAQARACRAEAETKAQTVSESAPMQRIVARLRQRTRHDFSLYKSSTLNRRIERRMAIHGIASLDRYAGFLDHNPQEIDLLFKELLIGVTSFFRDPAVWDNLASEALPELLARPNGEHNLRAWSVGCSTGEEAYSLAIVFSEVLQRLPQPHAFTVQIFASDLSPDAIETARRGRYPLSIASSMSAERLQRFFTTHETFHQIEKPIRDMVLFARHDVVLDPPFTRLDLILCRNLLIYFDQALQRRLMPLFHYSLRRGGMLQLGSSETIGRFTNLFAPIHSKARLYLRQDQVPIGGPDFLLKSFPPLTRISKEHPVRPPSAPTPPIESLQKAADEVLLQVFAPAAVVLNADGDIVYISGRTGKYLEPAAGKANWNIHAMARDGLRSPLTEALRKAGTQREPVQMHGLKVQTAAGIQLVDVTVQAFHEPATLRGMTMIVFRDVVPAPGPGQRARRKTKGEVDTSQEAMLQQYIDEIESLREETRASKEELQSSNEELQSTNEELQSANEELTTSKEEMQSMNEELQTINTELQAKLDDLALAQSDMKNVLNSIEIAILFLDHNLHVRRFTDRAAKLINLREVDIGRPLSDLTSSLQYSALHEDALETLSTLVPSERKIETNDGRRFKVRIMPYRRQDNMIDGVVITLLDLTSTEK
jgi:two-component system, chemotaxis family, CheB/CheR fusion protein